MEPSRADEVAQRARIRHEHLLAKRERAEALRREVASLRTDLRMLAADVEGRLRRMNEIAAALASKVTAHLDELAQDETTIRLPALEPKTERLRPPGGPQR